jgi:hypothetical protein
MGGFNRGGTVVRKSRARDRLRDFISVWLLCHNLPMSRPVSRFCLGGTIIGIGADNSPVNR